MQFTGHNKIYNLQWTELLNRNDMPFADYEDVAGEGTLVMAPWQQPGGKIQFSEACVVKESIGM